MPRNKLIITSMIFLTIGIVLVVASSGILNNNDSTDNLTIENAFQIATDQALDGQDIPETALTILRSGLEENENTSSENTVIVPEPYQLPLNANLPESLEANLVDTLIDGSKVYYLSRDYINSNNLNKILSLESTEEKCINGCILIKTNKSYSVANTSIYYVSSFVIDSKPYWLSFVKTNDGYTYAQISDPYFLNSKVIYFTNEYVKKINRTELYSSKYKFELESGETITVDFKDKV